MMKQIEMKDAAVCGDLPNVVFVQENTYRNGTAFLKASILDINKMWMAKGC